MARLFFRILIALTFPLLVVSCARKGDAVRPGVQTFNVPGPANSVELKVFVDNGQLKYSVTRGGASVIEPSPMVFTVDGVDLAKGVLSTKTDTYSGEEQY